MKTINKIILAFFASWLTVVGAEAQTDTSTATLRRGSSVKDKKETSGITNRDQRRIAMPEASESELGWMRVIYRSLDLTKPENAPLFYPEPPVDGQENLFRTLFRLVASGKVKAYEYLDGRENFSDGNELVVKDMLDRFRVPYKEPRGAGKSTVVVEDTDVPSNEILSYYIIERYELDNKNTRMRTVVDAICPVLHRNDDWGVDVLKYPMFWVRFNDLRPFLTKAGLFVSDENNIQSYSYDDYFLLGLYNGEIVKTRNALNKSLAEMYPDKDALKQAQDSIQHSLDTFGKGMWTPSLEQLQQRSRQREIDRVLASGGDTTGMKDANVKSIVSKRGAKKQKSLKIKSKRAKAPKVKSSSSAVRSVRNRRR